MAADDPLGVRALITEQMTLSEFARLMRSTQQTVNHWISRGIPGQRLFAAADILGKNADDLRQFTAEGRKPRPDVEREVRAFARLFDSLTAAEQEAVISRLERKRKHAS